MTSRGGRAPFKRHIHFFLFTIFFIYKCIFFLFTSAFFCQGAGERHSKDKYKKKLKKIARQASHEADNTWDLEVWGSPDAKITHTHTHTDTHTHTHTHTHVFKTCAISMSFVIF